MTIEFIAHPVSEGDAFELRWDDKRVLIDGGRHPQETLRLVLAAGGCSSDGYRFDAAICTHNDRD